ncbi:MAG: malto-oligosyltrehalose synthase [Oscillochloris sp.]|nr:malto-oligosyltrehalose synthase [Oscillochloris sp.]
MGRLKQHIPRCTYRLQFNADFTLTAAEQIVAYLDELGISDLYASPLLTPRSGSSHGYDTTDHGRINPEIGGERAFDRLSAALTSHGLGLMLDVVPNHMGIGDQRNGWWLDVLENGPSSIYAPYFDIDWDPVAAQLQNKVLLPVLGDQYGNILERGELTLHYEDGAFYIAYWDYRFPVNPRSYADLLAYHLESLIEQLGPDHSDVMELESIVTAIKYLPPRTEIAPDRVAERNREKEVIKRRIDRLYKTSRPVCLAVDATVAEYHGSPDDPQSFDLLDRLIDEQPYRLAFWRVATEEINYRRFFDINDLAAIRVELPDVLQATHQLIFRFLAEGKAHGLRIDHPDGLWDPGSYFRQLQTSYLYYWAAHNIAEEERVPDELGELIGQWLQQQVLDPASAVDQPPAWPLYVLAEKILAHHETLPEDWAIAGTSGYDFLNEVLGVLINRDARKKFDRLYTDVAGPQPAFANLLNSKKKEILLISLASELNTLSHLLDKLSEHNRRFRDFTLNGLTFALREVLAALPVYRTYISGPDTVAEWDVRFVDTAVRDARRRNPRTAAAIFNFIGDTLTLRNLESFNEETRPEVLRFVMKFQQLSGPVMAKGVEDTAFYVYNRLVALNEVGGHPELFGHELSEMHQRFVERRARWSNSMLASSTHDTKRSEDVRARIAVLSEMPDAWRQMVILWSRLNQRKKTTSDGAPMPQRNDEYLLYQTLIGTWPAEAADSLEELETYRDRIAAYMEKATREAKVVTSWINPNPEYDAAVHDFVHGILDPRRSKRFLESLANFSKRVAYFGRFNALTQALIKFTSPGVPDIYQGCELWDFSLVDPDNRRPVDYGLRKRLLRDLRQRTENGELASLAAELLEHAEDGRIKLYLTHRVLTMRREQPALFAEGEYLPLEVGGARAEHVIAYARRHGDAEMIVVAPRLTALLAQGEEVPPLGDLWHDTRLSLPESAGTRYRDLFSGVELTVRADESGPGLALSEILSHFPIALLEKK